MYKKDRRFSANRSVHHHDEKEVVIPPATIKVKLTNQEFEDSKTIIGLREMKQEEFAPYRGRCAAGVVRRVQGLRGRNSAFEPREVERQVVGLFNSVLSESFG
jgi:hypothetical protein